jgi:phosphate transport system permease protein
MEERLAPLERQSLGCMLLKKKKLNALGFDTQKFIRFFFASNASVTIIVLVLIMLMLLREGAGFLKTYKYELETYRQAGLEFCDIVDRPLAQHQQLTSRLRRALGASLDTISQNARNRRDAYLNMKRQVEEESALQREALAVALEQTPSAGDKIIAPLRSQLAIAGVKSAMSLTVKSFFSLDEADKIRAELSQLSPDSKGIPAFLKQLNDQFSTSDKAAKNNFATLVEATEIFEKAPETLQEILNELKEHVLETKTAASEFNTLKSGRLKLLEAAGKTQDPAEKADLLKEAAATQAVPVDFHQRIKLVISRADELAEKVHQYITAIQKAAANLPTRGSPAHAIALLEEVHHQLPLHVQEMQTAADEIKTWSPDKPVSFLTVIGAFFFGSNWITNSSWQDSFGFVPLLTGSLIISLIAIIIATPISLMAAIYSNQFASEREKEFIKPVIEFIQAIPSIVLGFIGISVLGDLIKDVSEVTWLQWIPGFPIQERLNMFNAGCLLALMAIPTMFSLSEDALNNVPEAYVDASDALGATKLQTVFRVIVPSAFSGMAAAVLLGIGRVIGETMVVLLVAGNRIAIPDFSSGAGVVFQPAHTLTGIIAQELGEVSRGSTHWQALFMVGIVLFCISLIINWCARTFVRRFEQFKA